MTTNLTYHNSRRNLIYLYTFMFLSVALMQAGITGKVKGRVWDLESGDPLPGANVQITGTTLGAATDIDGYYFVLNVPPGRHEIVVTFVGYVNSQRIVNVIADLMGLGISDYFLTRG